MTIGSRKTVGEIEALPEFDDYDDPATDPEWQKLRDALKAQAAEHEPTNSDYVLVKDG